MSAIRRVAQTALAIPFLVLGYQTVTNPGPRVEAVAEFGLPEPETLTRATGAAMVLGAAALALNKLPRAAAVGLAASLAPTTLAGHPFWKADDASTRQGQQIHFLKNVGLIGGLLTYAASGSRRSK